LPDKRNLPDRIVATTGEPRPAPPRAPRITPPFGDNLEIKAAPLTSDELLVGISTAY
jgi:hypothetical protein